MSELAYYRTRKFGLLSDCHECSPSPNTFERLMVDVEHDEIERYLIEHVRKLLEDACRTRKGCATFNQSTIRKLAMQIIKEHYRQE